MRTLPLITHNYRVTFVSLCAIIAQVVRCVGSHRSTWHPASDGLLGTDSYGNYAASYLSDTTFSIPWDVLTTVTYDHMQSFSAFRQTVISWLFIYSSFF